MTLLVNVAEGIVPPLRRLLKAGYAVVRTDYEGLGTPGVHPYLVAASEGRSVLDAAAAARSVPDAEVGDRVVDDVIAAVHLSPTHLHL